MAGNRVVIFEKVAGIGLIAKIILSEVKNVTKWVIWDARSMQEEESFERI